MKIERPSVTITEIPYFDSIEVMLSGILLTRGASEQTFHVADIEAIRDALNEAIRIKREMSGEPEFVPPTPYAIVKRVWSEGDTKPGPEVAAVTDSEGDRWERIENGAWQYEGSIRTWGALVLDYGPLTEVLP